MPYKSFCISFLFWWDDDRPGTGDCGTVQSGAIHGGFVDGSFVNGNIDSNDDGFEYNEKPKLMVYSIPALTPSSFLLLII